MIPCHAPATARAVLLCLLSGVLLGADAMAQTARLTTGSASGAMGTVVSIPIGFDPGAASVNMLQFDLMFSPSLSFLSIATGPAALSADKTVWGNSVPGRARILVFGLNQNVINAGVIAEIQLAIAADMPAGLIPVVMTGVVASDPLASPPLISGTAGGVTVLPRAGGIPPVIGKVVVSEVTSSSATISWATDKPCNSEVDYWVGSSAIQSANLSGLTTEHSLGLNRLEEMTLYRYRVKSTDSEGNEAVSPEFSFQTTEDGPPALALPRLALAQNQPLSGNMSFPLEETMIGMGLANLGLEQATVTLTAVESDGSPVTGQDVINPRIRELKPGAQLALLDLEAFGDGLLRSDSNGWIKLESTTSGVDGFFLIFDTGLSLMDGASFLENRTMDFAFIEIRRNGRNKINIANSNPEVASITLDLMNSDGTVRSSLAREISPNGALVADLFGDLFKGIEPDDSGYVRVHASKAVRPFQVIQREQGDISALEGQDLTTGGTILYSPQYVMGGGYSTSFAVLNLDSRVGTVQFRFIGEDGLQIGAAQYRAIPANGKLRIDDQEFFLTGGSGDMVTGYAEIISDGVRLAGSTVFGDSLGTTFFSALALVSGLQKSMIFSHVASDAIYFTGIAVLNPGMGGDATATLELYAADGTLMETVSVPVPAGHRKARLLTEYFTSLVGRDQTSGYVRLTSDQPVASFSLFGTHNLSVLSAIPPQATR